MKGSFLSLCALGFAFSASGGTIASIDVVADSGPKPIIITAEPGGYMASAYAQASSEVAVRRELTRPDVTQAINGTVPTQEDPDGGGCQQNCTIPEPVPFSLMPGGLLALYMLRRVVRRALRA